MTRNETSPDDAAPARQRIAKLMARVGLCSRRDAEAWIVDGRVSVNGTVLTSPAVDVALDDQILVDGAPLPKAEKTRLFLFHKPRGLVTSDHDPEGRATVADYLREHWPEGPRGVTVGRLDINTEGLLLLTNDGGLARILELPRTGWVRRYRVRAKGETDQAVLDGLREGVTIDGIDYAGIEATLDRVQGANVWLTMALREGKNREVKRVLESIGLEVNRLIRLSFGPFQLGDLPEGAVEEVRTRVLRDQLGPTLAAAAGVAFDGPAAAAETTRTPREGRAGTTREQRDRPAQEKPKREGRRAAPGAETKRGSRSAGRAQLRPSEAPPPLRERPVAGTRKHVSTLRAADAAAAQHGPRRRIERSDVTDRNDRAVRVERLVDTRPARPEPRPRRQRDDEAPRGRRPERPQDRDRQEARYGKPGGRRADARHARPDSPSRRDSPPDRTDRRDAGARRHASPSALAKRVRVSKSGGDGETARRSDRRSAPPSKRRNEKDGGKAPRPRAPTRRPGREDRRDAQADGGRLDGKRTGTDEARRAPRGEGGGKRFTRKPSGPGAESGPRRPRASTESRSGPRPARAGSGARGGDGERTKKPDGTRRRPGGKPAPRSKR